MTAKQKYFFGEFGKLATQYNNMRPVYPKKIISIIQKTIPLKRPTILDLGCGTGISTRQLSNIGIVIGCDADRKMLKVASQYLKPNISYENAKSEKLPFDNARFDAVTAFISFHWFMNKKAINEIKRVLKPNGVLCIVQPRFASFQKDYRMILERELRIKIPKKYKIASEILPFLNANDFQISCHVVKSNVTYSLPKYIELLKSYSLWNYVPISRREKIESMLKSHFKTKLRKGHIQNTKNIEVIIAIPNRNPSFHRSI